MPRTSLVDPIKAKAAVSVLIRASGITVREAMILAKFSEEEAGCKSMQRKVSRDAQKVAAATGKKGKARPSSVSASESSPPIEEVNFSEDQSPNSMSSVTEEDDDTRKKPPKKEKKHRLNAKQMQEKRQADLLARAKFSRAHKAATRLYAAQLDREEGGMSSRQVEAFIKKKYGVGPSHATIHHYVVKRGDINVSPAKRGPEGNISAIAYKSLCAAFASFMQINQLNGTSGINKRGKMAPLVAEAMMVDIDVAREIIRRLSRDTAIDLSRGKLDFAEERRVRWTTYDNLDLWFSMWERELLRHGLAEL